MDFRKENVQIKETWGNYKRVSDNMRGPGSISTNITHTISEEITENIDGITTISKGESISSEKGYTLHVPDNKSYYIAYRVRYKVESGYRVKEDVFGGKKRNYYLVKKQIYGEYVLMRAY